ncbi:TPA: interferon beta-like [Bos taurus]|nr:TPA: interferon beta-like [Bos taurus]
MTYRCLLPMVLLLCFSTTALSRSYSLLRFQQRRSAEVCQKLLGQLHSTPQHCLEARMDFQVPEEMNQAQQFRKEDAILVIYEMLQQIFNILTRDFSSTGCTGWSETIIEDLLEELYGQMNRLQPIQKEIMQKQNPTAGDTIVPHLGKYYFNLMQYLESKEYDRCAWTVVQVQILTNVSFLMRLTGYVRD